MDTVKADPESDPLWIPGDHHIKEEPLVSVKEEVSLLFSFFLSVLN